MTTLFLLLVAFSALSFTTLNEKHISYVSATDFGKKNTRNNASDVNDTENCSRKNSEKARINDSANWGIGKLISERNNVLSRTDKKITVFGTLRNNVTNENLTADNGFNVTNKQVKKGVAVIEPNYNNVVDTFVECKLLFILFNFSHSYRWLSQLLFAQCAS